MSYYISKTIESDFENAIKQVTETLKTEGFGVISTIDIQEKLKEKLDVDFKKYIILGACNPGFAYKALQMEDKIGVMLPCNVIVQEQEPGKIEVSAVDPLESMQAVKNQELGAMAGEVRNMLARAIEKL
ncbi:MAG: DUF302 domain-containing protein [Bacteroidales bacterium]|nr:DUF302 domain-containing protein [Bacteroidales bacterium]